MVKLRYVMNANLENMTKIRDELELSVNKEGFPKPMETSLIFEESFMNVVDHAYEDGTKKTVNVKIDVTPLLVKLVILDSGKEFNPVKYEPQTPDINAVGGHGIRLIKQLSRTISYKRKNNKNELTIII